MPGVLRKLAPEAIGLARTVLRYRADPVASMQRYWQLYRHRYFSPDEIRFFQLLDPALTSDDLERVVSKEELVRLQDKLNPSEARALTEDKLRFHERCVECGLRVPALLGVIEVGATAHGHAHECRDAVRDSASIQRLLDTLTAESVILKPADGVNGEGVMRLRRRADGWADDAGAPVDAQAILERTASTPYTRWMMQETVQGHPELCRLSSTQGLQTVRVVTALQPDGEVRILATRLRLICGDLPYDNFNYGTTGNVIANVDVEGGFVVSLVRNDHGTMRFIDVHPRTGVPLHGYRPPLWDAVKELARRAARHFTPLTTVGWDIGIALPEPVLIEGNATWGILSGEPRMGEIYRYLQTLQR